MAKRRSKSGKLPVFEALPTYQEQGQSKSYGPTYEAQAAPDKPPELLGRGARFAPEQLPLVQPLPEPVPPPQPQLLTPREEARFELDQQKAADQAARLQQKKREAIDREKSLMDETFRIERLKEGQQKEEEKRLLNKKITLEKDLALAQRFRSVGPAAGQGAAGDTGVFGNAAESALQMIPRFGQTLSAALVELPRQLMSGAGALGQRLSPFNSELTMANVNAQLRQLEGDFRRAELLGPEMAKFTEARTDLEQAGQDLLAELLQPILPILTDALRKFLEFYQWLRNDVPNSFINGLNTIIIGLNKIIDKLPGTDAETIKLLGRIATNTEKEDEAGVDLMREFLRMASPRMADPGPGV